MKLSQIVIGVIAVAALALGYLGYSKQVEPLPGASLAQDLYFPVFFHGGIVDSNQVATTTNGSMTLSQSDLQAWSNSSVVSVNPIVTSGTITLPASSTLKAIVPRAGDMQSFCVRNATTTTGVTLTLAGGTGTNLLVASSTATAVGSLVLLPGKTGCITMVRGLATPTTFDIDFLLTVFK